MLPVIVIGAAVVGMVALLLGDKSSAARAPLGTVAKPSSRTRVVKGEMPGQFALKYGGSFNLWKDLPSVNPGMRVAKWNQWETDEGWVDTDPGRPCSDTNPGPCPIRTIEGLTPWADGQVVTIPDSWGG